MLKINLLYILGILSFFSLSSMDRPLSKTDIKKMAEARASSSNELDPFADCEEPDIDDEIFISKKSNINFKDLQGDIPDDLENIVDIIKFDLDRQNESEAYKIILYGPPGTGKTTLSEAIAGELEWPFLHCSSEKLLNEYQGSANKLISRLARVVKNVGGKAVLFIDEIDGIANKEHSNKHAELNLALISLHTLFDQFKNNFVGIIATNHLDKLPPTILSRFPNKILIDLPDELKAVDIIKSKLGKKGFAIPGIENISDMLDGLDCRQLEEISRQAFIVARVMKDDLKSGEIPIDSVITSVYIISDNICVFVKDVKLILSFCIKSLLKNITQSDLDSLINNDKIKNKLVFKTYFEIKSCVIIAKSLAKLYGRLIINTGDLYLATLKPNNQELLNSTAIEESLTILLNRENMKLSDIYRKCFSLDSENNISLIELVNFVKKAKRLCLNVNNDNEGHLFAKILYSLLFKILRKKAKLFHVTESLQSNISKSPTIGISFIVTLNFLSHNKITSYLTITKTPLSSISEFNPSLSHGVTNSVHRIEYCNNSVPTVDFVIITIISILEKYPGLDIKVSAKNFLISNIFRRVIVFGELGSFTISEIVEEACKVACHKKSANCKDEHIIKALSILGFREDHYKHIDFSSATYVNPRLADLAHDTLTESFWASFRDML